MTPRDMEEYTALRATIRERGTARVCLFLVGVIAWAALAAATAALVVAPVATLLPLLVLAATFEAVLSLHVGVERVGRYLQVFFEDDAAGPGWERRIMQFDAVGAFTTDPLFCAFFWLGAVLNLVPAVMAEPLVLEWAVVGGAHALFAAHVARSRRRAAAQRARDLERFTAVRRAAAP